MIQKKFRTKSKLHFDRLTFLALMGFILTLFIIFRLFVLQILMHEYYETETRKLHKFSKELLPRRGEIYVQGSKFKNSKRGFEELYPIATNLDLNLLFAIPKEIEAPEKVAEKLAPILRIDKIELLQRLSKKNDLYEPLKHYLTDEEVKKIKDLKIRGLAFAPENKRFYPEKNLFSHLLGFVGYKGEKRLGQYGLEESYEEILAGKKGFLKGERGVFGQWIAIAGQKKKEVQHGADLILTLDYTVQFVACKELQTAVERFGAEGGSVVVVDPKTGRILASCSFPDFDPNEYNQIKDFARFLDPTISHAYEPGSIFKIITMAAALDAKVLTSKTTYHDKGFVKIGKYTIENFDKKARGEQTMIEVLEKSLNTGAIFVAEKLGLENFRRYVQNFGFGEISGIELPNEIKGDISSLKEKSPIHLATASFGQGISVTPLQMITAFVTIVNEGKLMKPYLIEKIIWPDGTTEERKPEIKREVISPSTAAVLKAMLVSVVENGHGKRARVPGYFIGGKTGTAQVSKRDQRGYDPDKTVGSFIGFGPVDDPRFVILVKIDNPKGVVWAESSAAPTFGKIAKFLLDYYQIPPERE